MRNGLSESKKGGALIKIAESLGVSALKANAQLASLWFCYQEEEPDGIAELLRKRKSVNY